MRKRLTKSGVADFFYRFYLCILQDRVMVFVKHKNYKVLNTVLYKLNYFPATYGVI